MENKGKSKVKMVVVATIMLENTVKGGKFYKNIRYKDGADEYFLYLKQTKMLSDFYRNHDLIETIVDKVKSIDDIPIDNIPIEWKEEILNIFKFANDVIDNENYTFNQVMMSESGKIIEKYKKLNN